MSTAFGRRCLWAAPLGGATGRFGAQIRDPERRHDCAPTACRDEIKTTENGDPKAVGISIGYTTTMAGADGEPDLVTTEVTEFEVTTLLDAALFDIPQG
jgi:hypothetical protein